MAGKSRDSQEDKRRRILKEAAREFVPQTVLDDPAIFPPESIVDRLSFTEALDAEVEDRYSKAFAAAKGS